MKHNIPYLSYMIRHKWFVFLACLKVKAPLWNAIIHDWSKFTPSEWIAYAHYFYGTGSKRYYEKKFVYAWSKHINVNPHHWQHWVLIRDDGRIVPLEMPEKYIREMVADWAGAGRTITGKWEVYSWYETKKSTMMLNPVTKKRVEELLDKYYKA